MDLITGEVIQKIFAISPDQNNYGSCISYPVNGHHWLITAAHVLGKCEHAKPSTIFFWMEGKWRPAQAIPYFHAERPYQEGDIDLAIVKTEMPSKTDVKTMPELTTAGMALGQESFFLGFPYFGHINYKSEKLNSGFPFPLVKKATISGVDFERNLIYLDAHNNPGFSGGPLIFLDRSTKKKKIGGVISSYISQSGEIKELTSENKGYYEENSGIGLATNIRGILEIMEWLGIKF